MNIIAWIILGALAGWIASMLVGKDAEMGIVANILTGIAGAFIGGFIFNLFGGSGVTGFNLWSLLVAVMGSFILLLVIKAFRRA